MELLIVNFVSHSNILCMKCTNDLTLCKKIIGMCVFWETTPFFANYKFHQKLNGNT